MNLKKISYYHIFPFVLALGLVVLFVCLTSPIRKQKNIAKDIQIKGKQSLFRGYLPNLTDGNQAEIEYISSIKNKNQLTVFGSSEFSEANYAPFFFFPDSLGIQCLGIGHAFHQELSILVELLAAKEYLKGSKICIVLSPGWFENDKTFEDKGTNIEAFLEFARPNFLNKIVHDLSIDKKYKIYLGGYIHRNYEYINGASKSMNQLRSMYLEQSNEFVEKTKMRISEKIMGKSISESPSYHPKLHSEKLTSNWNKNWEESMKRVQAQFISQIKTNKIYVNDPYFTEYLLKKNGKVKTGSVSPLDYLSCREYLDFKILVELLKEYEVEGSFIIQGLNPYYYKNMSYYDPLIKAITKQLDREKIPYLNLFTSKKENYEKGMLKDIMHMGDYGWLKVNQFLYKTHYE